MIKNTFFVASLLAGSVAILGCAGKDSDTGGTTTTDDTGTGGTTSGPVDVSFDTVGFGCSADAYWFDVYTTGLSVGGYLFIYQTGSSTPWNEEHSIGVNESDPAGAWTRLYLELDSVYPDPSAVVSGSTTLYDCATSTGMEFTLTYIIEIDDSDGTPAIECVVWGNNPDAAPADDCARITPDTVSQMR